ncbi:MAG: hypothetical protein MJZ61_10445, partial [Bacteroidales bacterium]|nr:hypothetical protein [Bacteroidales bacterium]
MANIHHVDNLDKQALVKVCADSGVQAVTFTSSYEKGVRFGCKVDVVGQVSADLYADIKSKIDSQIALSFAQA